MNILVVAKHYPVASGRYLADALRRLGHAVRTVGEPMGTQIWGMTVDERYVWHPEPPEKKWTPDLVLYADSNVPFKRYGDAPHVVYGVDNHVCDYAAYAVDHLFLAHGHGYRIGEANVTWLPCGYDPAHFTPGPPNGVRPYDVGMIGVVYGTRAELLYALREQVPQATALYGTGALYDQYAQAYQSCRISLVKSAHDDVAMRVWETAAMGCLLVLDVVEDVDALGLVHGENCLLYHTPKEACDAIRWALANPYQAQGIAEAGQAWAAPGTWETRLQVILDWAAGQGKPAKVESVVSEA